MSGDEARDGRTSIENLFPDQRESGETPLRRCQLVLIRMLRLLDHVCAESGIDYWMTSGTLIGAVRHKGVIPWDCDIDVGMTEPDYRRLVDAADCFPPDIFFQNVDTEPSYTRRYVEAKLRDRYSNYSEWGRAHPEVTWHNGLQLDIFVYRKNWRGRLVDPIWKTTYRRSEIFPLIRLEFEGAMLCAPACYDGYLRRRYGDYMEPPPPGERVPSEGVADPTSPCDHPESLRWPDDKVSSPVAD